jgi:hypothetical protein
MAVEPTQTLREAAAILRREEGLDTADPGARWVWVRLGPIPFAYPNTKGRQRVLLAHDLHHTLAGYGTSLVGEAETAAWEFGTGMRDRSAVRYAIRVFGFVRPFAPARLRTAFVRGRHGKNLLDRELDDATLSRTVGDLRRELGLDRPVPAANEADRSEFDRWSARAIAVVWGPLVPLAAFAVWWLF